MKVKLLQDQYYIAVKGAVLCGKKGETVDIDPLFVKHIAGKYEIEAVEEKKEEKALNKMNKEELIAKAKSCGIELGDKDYETMNKAQLIEIIEEVINK